MNYRLNAARSLYAKHVHPRVFLGPADMPALRRAVRTGVGRTIMTGLRRRVKPLVAGVLAAPDLPQMLAQWNVNWHMPGTRVVFGIVDMALVAVVDEDADTLAAVCRVLAACPVADSGGRQGVRRLAYSMAGQMSMAYDLVQPRLSAAAAAAFRDWAYTGGVQQVLEVLPAARFYKCAAGNMNLGGVTSAIQVLLALEGDPGVPDAAEAWRRLLPMLEAAMFAGIGPEGYPEEDIGYGTAVTAEFACVVEPLRRAGIYDVYRRCPRYARFGRAMLHFVQPWGEYLSNTGDHGDDFGHREFILARLAAETRQPELLWLLGTLSYNHGCVHPENDQPEFYIECPLRPGAQVPATAHSLFVLKELAAPARKPVAARMSTAFCDRARGIVSFRSGWGKDDTFVVFDGSQRSPAAQGHAHASCGHFSLSALGEYFSVDTGRYHNEQSCHSVVLIDGKSGRSTNGEWVAVHHHGRLTAFNPGPFVDTASVDSSHQHACYWARRHLGLVKGRGPLLPYAWVVDDINKADDWAEYWWQLQSSPENSIVINGQVATITGWRHGNLLDVHFILPTPDEYPRPHVLQELTQDIGTVSSYKYVPDPAARVAEYLRPAAMLHGPVYQRPRLLAKIAGYNGRFMALLLPRRPGTEPARVERLPGLPATLAVKIVCGDVEDVIVFAFEHHVLEAGGVSARAPWCVVRRRRDSGRVLARAQG